MTSHLLALAKEGAVNEPGVLAHLAELIRGSVDNKSELKGLSNIEIFSYYLRKNKFQFSQFLEDGQLGKKIGKMKEYPAYVTAVEELTNKIGRIDNSRIYQRPDIVQDMQALRTAGISVGETNTYHLAKVIKVLAVENQVKSIRFWGKILGHKDYYVIQGVSSKQYLDELPENAQKYGVGVNTYSFWVATDILGRWAELPLVTPNQVTASRTFKYIFTGELEAAVHNSPTFKGQEKHLLKCVLARITHSTELVPKGLYKLNEENPTVIEYQEEFKLPEVAEMNSLENWAHLNPNILQQGRSSYYVDPKLSEEQKEALAAELAEKDPIIERLKGIADDKPYQALGYAANWTVGISGESVPVNQIGKQEGTTLVYGVTALRNLVWPGAVTVGYRGNWVNIYIGYGHRVSQQLTTIRELRQLQTEGQQRPDYREPNPSKPPAEPKKQEVPPPQE